MADQELVNIIEERYAALRNDHRRTYHLNTYRRKRILLFKEYMGREEEFKIFLANMRTCYVFGFGLPCPTIACQECKKTKLYDMILKEVNHIR